MTALALPRRDLWVPRFEPWRLLRPLKMAIDGQFAFYQKLQGEDIERRYVPAAGGGPTVTFTSLTLDTNDSGDANYTSRTWLDASLISTSGTLARVRFVASTALGLKVDNAAIGQAALGTQTPNTLATPIELLFSGAHGFNISAGATIVSDWATFTLDETKGHVVILDYSSTLGNPRYTSSYPGAGGYKAATWYKSATDSYNQATLASPPAAVSGWCVGFNQIEVQ